ncbi:MAG TPA: serine/threonine-protein kinase [Thermoanaerobaculia bacterium]|nr:serine/threonine-protein kinase [Thermoanaerobaculia bacterium]
MQSGQQIRDYVLDRKIGEGGMGQVWTAHHQVLGRKVAIKAMSSHVAARPEFEGRFIQEAKAQATLSHPRILGVNEFFIHDDVYYLVMPYIDGESLESRLERAGGPLPLDRVLPLARDLLDALDYAHQRGIIHRDVKPSNILLDADGRAYLMDFGIALLVGKDRKTRTGTSLGTPYYMSPEQIRTRDIDHRTDVYSIGCVLYEALAGRPPFMPLEDGDTDFLVMEAHLKRQAEPLHRVNPKVPEGISNLVSRAMAKEPTERFSGCGEFLRALHAYEYHGTVEPPPLRPRPAAAAPATAPPLPPPQRQPPPVQAAPSATSTPLHSHGTSPHVRKPRRWLWFLVGGGIVGCLLLFAFVAFVMWAAEQAELDDSGGGGDFYDPPPRSEPAAQQEETAPTPDEVRQYYHDQIELQMQSRVDYYTGIGYTVKTHNLWIDSLAEGETDNLDFALEAGVDHVVLGVCDEDCVDLDFELTDENGVDIASDTAIDGVPLVNVTPQWTGDFHLEVEMHDCDSSICYYGVIIYGRPAS